MSDLVKRLRDAVENPVMGVVSVPTEKLLEFAHCIEQLERELAEVRQYGTHLAQTMAAKHYPENKTWEVLPDTVGVLTQIDNMIAGIADQLASEKALADRLASALRKTWAGPAYIGMVEEVEESYRKARGL